MAANPKKIDMSGQRFGLWTVIQQSGNAKNGAARWDCICECGTEAVVVGSDLRSGKSVSCGCYRNDITGSRNRTHGLSSSRVYNIWQLMKRRCNDKGNHRYGRRGIEVCREWRDSFEAFNQWAQDNGYTDDLSIERIDINQGYNPTNCKFIPLSDQAFNRSIVMIAPDGDIWWHKAKKNGITRSAFGWRKSKGWPMELVVSWPLGKRREARKRDGSGRFT